MPSPTDKYLADIEDYLKLNLIQLNYMDSMLKLLWMEASNSNPDQKIVQANEYDCEGWVIEHKEAKHKYE